MARLHSTFPKRCFETLHYLQRARMPRCVCAAQCTGHVGLAGAVYVVIHAHGISCRPRAVFKLALHDGCCYLQLSCSTHANMYYMEYSMLGWLTSRPALMCACMYLRLAEAKA